MGDSGMCGESNPQVVPADIESTQKSVMAAVLNLSSSNTDHSSGVFILDASEKETRLGRGERKQTLN